MDLPAYTLSCFPVDRGQVTTLLTTERRACVIAFENRFHNAIDIIGTIGMALRAPVDGRVISIGDNTGDGGFWVMFVDLHGLQHYFAHMHQRCLHSPGTVFTAGASLGQLGQTGNARQSVPHLHYQIRGRANRGGPPPPERLAAVAFPGLFPELEGLDRGLQPHIVRPEGHTPLNPYNELARLAGTLGATRNPGGRWFIPAASSAMVTGAAR